MQKNNNKLLDRVRLQLNPCRKNSNQEAVFVICSFDTLSNRCLQVTVRRILQVEYLVQYVNEKYGGHIIPVLQLYNYFTTERQSEQQMYIKIKQYLNDLIKNPHCKLDPKLYEFIFQQEVHFPHLERYDKVLEDAAMLSRKYLNVIFTRKQYGEVQLEDKDMLETYEEFKEFATAFRAVREIVLVSGKQHNLLEDIFTTFREVRGGLGKGVPPIDFVTKRMKAKIAKLDKLIAQGTEGYNRWQVLRETVRELHCNINKGMHEEHAYYMQKFNQLKKWTRSLITDYRALVQKGNQIIEEYSKYLYVCRQEQSEWFGGGEEQEDYEEREREWDPVEQFKRKGGEWVERKMSH